MGKIENRDIIVIGPQPWDNPIGSNCKDIAREFAESNRVLYINRPMDWITRMKNPESEKDFIAHRKAVLSGKIPQFEQITPSMAVFTPKVTLPSINMLPDNFLYDALNKWVNRMLAKEIQKAADQMGFNNYIIFNDSDMFRGFYLKEMLKPEAYIYYSRDNLISTDYYKKHGARLEPKLMAKADVCVANSRFLADICKKYNPHSYDIGQGVDLTEWNPEKIKGRPDDIQNIEGPIIGYVGALLELRLDVGLLENLAKRHLDWQFLFVGPEDEAFATSSLHDLPNVTFTGPKKPNELPQYVMAFDVCLNPQAVNEMTIGNYPRKIDEYLAMGLPTVATLTPTMRAFEPHVLLASDIDEYSQHIQEGLDNNNMELTRSRREFALSHSWTESVRRLGEAYQSARK
ncbi:MAG: hypothetical protein SchgKO_06610 [Schleiferiaceae bacterium]